MSVRDKLIKGSSFRTVHLVLNVVISFFMMPFLIHELGDRMYGIWIIVGTMLGYYGLFDLGLSSAVTRFISRALGNGDEKEIREISATAFYTFMVIGLVAAVVTGLIVLLSGYLIKSPAERHLFKVILIIIGLDFSVGLPIKAFSGALMGNLRYDVNTTLGIVRTVVSSVLMVVVVKSGMGLLGMAMVNLLCSGLVYTLEVACAYRFVPHFSIDFRFARMERIKSLFGYSVYTFVSQIADMLRFKIDSLVIVAYLGASSVTLYFIGARLVEYFIQFVTNIMGVLTPVFSQYEGKKDFESLREKFYLTTKISTVCSVLFGGLVVFFGRAFIERWMGPAYLSAYPILLILCVPTALALMQVPSINLLYGISKHRFYTYANSAEGLLNLALSLILVRHYGLIGVAAGTAIPMVITKMIVQPIYVCRVAGIDYRRYIATVSKSAGLSMAALALPWFVLQNLMISTYSHIFILGSVNAALYLVFVLCFVFKKTELAAIHPALLRWRP